MANRIQHGAREERETIPGYRMGDRELPRAPISLDEVTRIKRVLGWSDQDDEALRTSARVLEGQTDDLVQEWFAYMRGVPELARAFDDARTGAPDERYIDRVKQRFAQWVTDTCSAQYDQAWLDYQFEIGQRHYRTKKGSADDAESTDIVPFRYLFALVPPVMNTLRPFLERANAPDEEVAAMARAWEKSLMLQVTLWSHPYVHEGDY